MIRGTFKEHLTECMKDPEFKKAWHDLDPDFELLESFIKAREKKGITQAELAKLIGTKQPALSRLEHGGFSGATVATLKKIADALDMRLIVKLQNKKAQGYTEIPKNRDKNHRLKRHFKGQISIKTG